MRQIVYRLRAVIWCVILLQVSYAQLPAGWSQGDIGIVGIAGTATFSNGAFSVAAAGSQIYGAADSFHFVYQPLSGDGTIVARIASFQSSSSMASAGIMVREGLTPGSTNVYVEDWPSNYRIYSSARMSASGTTSLPANVVAALPYWIKLARAGNVFSSYTSSDGITWTQLGPSQTVAMTADVYVGVAVTSGTTSALVTATVDNLTVSTPSSPAPVIAALSATTASIASHVTVTGANFGSSPGTLTLNGSSVATDLWTDTSIVFTVPATATSGLMVVSAGPTMNSNPVRFAVTAQPLPSGWLDADVGQVGPIGAATYANGTFTVSGAGGQVYGTADNFHFAYLPFSGDGTIVARIVNFPPFVSSASAGIMVRENLSPGSPNVYVGDWPYDYRIYLGQRTLNGGNTSRPANVVVTTLPYWVKLVRSGNAFSSYYSSDGINWTQLGSSQTISMASSVLIGFGVTSGTASSLATAIFDNVSISSPTRPAPVITGLSATTASVGSQVTVMGGNFGTSLGTLTLNGAPVPTDQWSDTSLVFTVPATATSGMLVVSTGPTMNSNPVRFAVTSHPLPPGWLDADVGPASPIGAATYANGTFTVSGAGGQIYGTADNFHFAYLPFTGDGTIVARLVSFPTFASSASAGIMVRESLDPGSPNVYVGNLPNDYRVYLATRTSRGGSTSRPANVVVTTLPYWVKLVRSGNTFTSYNSSDGVIWTQLGSSQAISIVANVYVGLAVTSGTTSAVTAATFDNVTVSQPGVPVPLITGLSATTGSVGSQVTITGINFGVSPGVLRLNGASLTADQWNDTFIVFTLPSDAASGLLIVSTGPTTNSNAVRFTVTSQPLPLGWLDADIGSVTALGSATYSNGVFTLQESGLNAPSGSPTDRAHFAYENLVGDGSIVARVVSYQGGTNIQVGVMVRESTDPSSVYVSLSFIFPSPAYFSYRLTTGQNNAAQTTNFSSPVYPYWTKLVRNGNTFSGYVSTDALTWIQVGTSTTVAMASNVQIGLFATSWGGGNVTAVFDNVSLTGGTTPIIATVAPSIGGVGTPVTISGANFGDTPGNSSVTINGMTVSSISSWSSSQIVALVPNTVSTGKGLITVTVNSIESNRTVGFTAINPRITSITPPAAAQGATVTITGSGFHLSDHDTTVQFNGANAYIFSQNDTSISVAVPWTAATGPVAVMISGIAGGPSPFIVEPNPTITGISPTGGIRGLWPVRITGSGFGATQSNSTVQFYGGDPAQILSWSENEIQAVVPDGASTGPITVVVGALRGQGPWFYITSITRLTDSIGNQSEYTGAILPGTWITSDSQGPGCSTCTVRGNTHSEYDANGNLLLNTDALGHTTHYAYDSRNNLTSESRQLDSGQTAATSYTYNSLGEVLTVTDALGHTTTNTYDPKGNLLSVTSPAPDSHTPGSVTQFQYDAKGQLTSIIDPLQQQTTLTYTAAGLIETITDAQQNVTRYEYDARGNRTAVVDAMQHRTEFSYDLGNRLTGITYPGSTSVGFGYDTRGRRTSVTDQNGKTTTYTYDDADRLTAVNDAAQHTTQYSYDTENNLLSITDANSHTTSFQYDAYGRVKETDFPSGLAESYVYDAVGNLTSKTDRKGQTITYVYDALDRLTHKGYPDSTGVEYIYDLVGKVQQVNDPTGTYTFAYDNMGRLVGTTTQYAFLPGVPYNMVYTYDAASNRTGFAAPDGTTNLYSYDTLNRLTGLTNSLTGQFGFSYDELSRRKQLTRPNGVNTNYTYDSLSRLLSVLHQAGLNTLDGASYTYDNAGNRISKTNYLNSEVSNFSYDNLYQLTGVTGTNAESYTYDAVGNRLSSLGMPSYNYNSSNQLTSTLTASYTYDNAGNTTSKTDSGGTTQYTWDYENRLTQVTLPGSGGIVLFKYDPFGRRISKSSSTGTSAYLYDGPDVLEEVDHSGALLARYTQGPRTDEPLSVTRSAAPIYYDSDALGSTTSLTDSSGTFTSTYNYGAFGSLLFSTGADLNPYRYTGREFDSETGLYYYRARYYDANTARFLSEDQKRFGGDNNFYRYVSDNPVNFSDPSGNCKIEIRFSKLGCGYYHSYIVTTDLDGSQTGYRGGPTTDLRTKWNFWSGMSGGSLGSTTQGGGSQSQSSNSSNSTAPGSGPGGPGHSSGPWGSLHGLFGPYLPGLFPDYSTSDPSQTVLDNGMSCFIYDYYLTTLVNEINQANIPYNPFSSNSNAFTSTLLRQGGIFSGNPDYWSPGWSTSLPVK